MAKKMRKKFRNLSYKDRFDEERIDKRHIPERERLSNRRSRWRERVNEDVPEPEYDPAQFSGTALGTVLNMRSSHHFVRLEETGNVIDVKVKGTLKKGIRNTTTIAAPGDEVHVEFPDNGTGSIVGVVPRKTTLSRPDPLRTHLEDVIVANVDLLLIVSSIGGPAFWPELVDRFLIYAEYYELDPVIVVNKIDLADPEELEEIRSLYADQLSYRVLFTSTEIGQGIDELKGAMRDRISVIVGLSGVGKSSLLNLIQPGLNLRVQSVNEAYGGEGRHTTRTTILYPLDIGGYVADTPGIRAFGLWDLTPEELDYYFVEFRDRILNCRFTDCAHHHEPGCAVRQAVENSDIAESRYNSFLKLFEETNPAWERPF